METILCDDCAARATVFLPSEQASERRFFCQRHAASRPGPKAASAERTRFPELDYWQMFERWERHRATLEGEDLLPRERASSDARPMGGAPAILPAASPGTTSAIDTNETGLGSSRCQRASAILWVASVALTAWVAQTTSPAPVATVLATLWPGLGLIAIKLLRPMVGSTPSGQRFIAKSFVFATFFPAVMCALTAKETWYLFSFRNGWALTIVLGGAFFVSFWRATLGWRSRLTHPVVLIVAGVAFGYSATVAVNCVGDNSTPSAHNVRVLAQRRVTGAKREHYFLMLAAWGSLPEGAGLDVPRDLFDAKPIGSILTISERKGRLGIPWLRLR
jgi:hypothetical protein